MSLPRFKASDLESKVASVEVRCPNRAHPPRTTTGPSGSTRRRLSFRVHVGRYALFLLLPSCGHAHPNTVDATGRIAAASSITAQSATAPAAPNAEPPRPEPDLDASFLAKKASAAQRLDDLIHPELGIFAVHNVAGAVPQLELFSAWPTAEVSMLGVLLPPDKVLTSMCDAEQWEAAYRSADPNDECDSGSEAMFPTELPVEWVLDIHFGIDEQKETPWIDFSYADLRRAGVLEGAAPQDYAAWTETQWPKLQTLSRATETGVFLIEHTVYFGRLEGRWYLVGIDAYDNACG